MAGSAQIRACPVAYIGALFIGMAETTMTVIGQNKGDRLLIGFAAETQNLIEEARRKLETKHCDMIVGNLVNQENIGFESDENEVVLVLSTGESMPLARASKRVWRGVRVGASASMSGSSE